MPTTAKTKAKKTADRKARNAKSNQSRSRQEPMSAVDLLEQDHREVEAYFDEFEGLEDDAAKNDLAQKICMALTVHTQIEEEIFYPQAREAIEDDDLLNEALVEHDGAKKLIAEIEEMEAGEELFDAKVKVLGEIIRHHVEEEEQELFPEVEKSEVDRQALGEQLARRKAELIKQMERV
jgi:hemerythrin superfamily protein